MFGRRRERQPAERGEEEGGGLLMSWKVAEPAGWREQLKKAEKKFPDPDIAYSCMSDYDNCGDKHESRHYYRDLFEDRAERWEEECGKANAKFKKTLTRLLKQVGLHAGRGSEATDFHAPLVSVSPTATATA